MSDRRKAAKQLARSYVNLMPSGNLTRREVRGVVDDMDAEIERLEREIQGLRMARAVVRRELLIPLVLQDRGLLHD